MRGTAKVDCVLPRPYGFIRRGQVVGFDIEAWDVKKLPWLKHFTQLDLPAETPKEPKDPKGKKDDGFLK